MGEFISKGQERILSPRKTCIWFIYISIMSKRICKNKDLKEVRFRQESVVIYNCQFIALNRLKKNRHTGIQSQIMYSNHNECA
jgi:hypothetical protein